MKNLLLVLTLLFTPTVVFGAVARDVRISDNDGEVLNINSDGTIPVSGGAGGGLETSVVYAEGVKVGPTNMAQSSTVVTYNGNQYVGLHDSNDDLTLCKRVTDSVSWNCVVYNGVPQTPTFTGAGLDDMTAGGVATSGITSTSIYDVEIDATGTPDTFKWRLNGGSYTTGVSITGSAQTLSNGVTITFAATTGHTLTNSWSFEVHPNLTVGQDVHQGIGLGFDSDGMMHVNVGSYVTAGGMNYRRMQSVESVDGITAEIAVDTGTGCGASGESGSAQSCDTQASYVTFFNDNSMGLYMFFRSNGASGDADTFLWKYDTATDTWARATGTDNAVKAQGRFINANADSRSSYISHPYVDSNNKAHFAWTYRGLCSSVQCEKGISYVVYDMTNGDFEKGDGSAQTIPVRYSNDDSIDAAGEDGVESGLEGMQYRTGIAVTSDGYKHVAYSKNDANGYLQVFYRYHNGTSWSAAIQLTSTADLMNYPDHRAMILSEGNTVYILYLSYTEGTGVNVLRSTDRFSTYTKYAILNNSMGTYGPGYGLFTIDRKAWSASNNIYFIFQYNWDFNTITYSRSPVFIVKWDPSAGATVRQEHSYGSVNYDDNTIGSIDGYIRLWGKVRYDNQNVFVLGESDDIDTLTDTAGDAGDGDVVELAAGTYTITADIDVINGVTIRGQGGYSQGCKTTISSVTDSVNAFDITDNNVRIEDLCISMSGQTSRGINAVKGTSGLYTGLYLKDVGITMTGAGSKVAVQLNNVSGEADRLYVSATSSNSSARGLYYYNTSTANTAATFLCNNCDITTNGNATISIAYEGTESTASQDGTLTLRNCKGVSTESAAGPTTTAIRATGGANGIVYVEGGWFSGADNDLVQSSSGVLNVKDSHLTNGTVSGTITYLGQSLMNNVRVGGNIGIGTSLPGKALDILSGTIRLVGIGTTTPGTLSCYKADGSLGYCTGSLTNSICGTCN